MHRSFSGVFGRRFLAAAFPFAPPYQMISEAMKNSRAVLFLAVCGTETVVFGMAEVIYLKVRRDFENVVPSD